MTRPIPAQPLWRVLRNHEGRYSLALFHHDIPAGWQQIGTPAPKSDCLQRIAQDWTDMRSNNLKESLA